MAIPLYMILLYRTRTLCMKKWGGRIVLLSFLLLLTAVFLMLLFLALFLSCAVVLLIAQPMKDNVPLFVSTCIGPLKFVEKLTAADIGVFADNVAGGATETTFAACCSTHLMGDSSAVSLLDSNCCWHFHLHFCCRFSDFTLVVLHPFVSQQFPDDLHDPTMLAKFLKSILPVEY